MRTRHRLITLLVAIALSLGLSAQAQAEGGGIRDALSSFGQKLGILQSSPENPFLEPDRAFMLSAEAAGPDRIAVHFRIADGYYLYRKMFGFRVVATGGVALGEAEYPTGKFKEDEFFGRMEVYYDAVEARLPVIRDDAARGRLPVLLEVDFQGCAEAGFCYPPMTREITLVLPAADSGMPGASGMMNEGGAAPNDPSSSRFDARAPSPDIGPIAATRLAIDALPAASGFQLVSIGADDSAAALPAQDRLARSLAEGALWLNLALFFGLGLLLAFTPCVLPMVPILSSLIIGQKGGVTTRRAFGLSLAFVLAMALTYTVAGVLAGLFGSNLQILFQNTWVIVAFSAVFVLLALSMFGFYELQMPSAWQTRLSRAGSGGGSYAGAGAMGFFSALIVGPCVAAPLAGILIYIGMSGDALLGGLSLFALSLGMGVPLLAVGASAGRLLPRVGPWMATIKAIFGILMLGVAIWLLERIILPQAAMLFWAALLIGTAVWAGSFDAIRNGVSLRFRAARTAGLVVLMYGAVVFVGALTGGRDVLQPLAGSSVAALGGFEAPKSLEFQDTRGLDGLRDAVAVAAADGRPSMLFFHAEWCVDCNTMKRRTFTDPGVQQLLADAVLLDTDVTAYDSTDQALLGQYGLFGPPAVLFFDAQGRELAAHRLVGHSGPRDFSARVRSAWP